MNINVLFCSKVLPVIALATLISFTNCSNKSTMKELTIKKISVSTDAPKEVLVEALSTAAWNKIDVINWEEFPYCPDVQFRMAYSDSAFIIQYKVKEKYIRAKASEDNGRVHLDACVEIFIAPDGGEEYYSLESNCVGVCLYNIGASRYNREFGDPALFERIKRYPSLGREPFAEERTGDFDWDIVLVLPYDCLFKHPGYTPEGKQAKANFFKCGDELTEAHFLTWNPVQAKQPDYHRPECFGILKFE